VSDDYDAYLRDLNRIARPCVEAQLDAIRDEGKFWDAMLQQMGTGTQRPERSAPHIQPPHPSGLNRHQRRSGANRNRRSNP
jgi:hypothetical protein